MKFLLVLMVNLLLKKKLTVEANCFYEQALNRKNFIRRLKKYGLLEEEEK